MDLSGGSIDGDGVLLQPCWDWAGSREAIRVAVVLLDLVHRERAVTLGEDGVVLARRRQTSEVAAQISF